MAIINNVDLELFVEYLTPKQCSDMLSFIINVSNYTLDVKVSYNEKISDAKLLKLVFHSITKVKPDSGKVVYSESDLTNLLIAYSLAPDSIKPLLDPVLEMAKSDLFSSAESLTVA